MHFYRLDAHPLLPQAYPMSAQDTACVTLGLDTTHETQDSASSARRHCWLRQRVFRLAAAPDFGTSFFVRIDDVELGGMHLP